MGRIPIQELPQSALLNQDPQTRYPSPNPPILRSRWPPALHSHGVLSPFSIPDSLETASAAKTAVASCRVSTTRMPTFSAATRMGEM